MGMSRRHQITRLGLLFLKFNRGFVQFAVFIGYLTQELPHFFNPKEKTLHHRYLADIRYLALKKSPIVLFVSFIIGVFVASLSSVTLKEYGLSSATSTVVQNVLLKGICPAIVIVIMLLAIGSTYANKPRTHRTYNAENIVRELFLPRIFAVTTGAMCLYIYSAAVSVASTILSVIIFSPEIYTRFQVTLLSRATALGIVETVVKFILFGMIMGVVTAYYRYMFLYEGMSSFLSIKRAFVLLLVFFILAGTVSQYFISKVLS